jgi:catechol-2,3-dioxygenase
MLVYLDTYLIRRLSNLKQQGWLCQVHTRGLSHINLNVSDIDRSARFYQEVFGVELLSDYPGPMGLHPRGRQMIFSTPDAKISSRCRR